ncbi:MAG TPA: hypothetical protein VK501_23995 [Baekduia sp.]|uniref:hypothetical protein n=1 Tax=Baekduia sp. TaxID=2600305 RepID=UPI002B53155C|nr:hypothetical protein [Baekduia sp.]HMJ36990.1 hypothetical protein [Baekduia sp.]
MFRPPVLTALLSSLVLAAALPAGAAARGGGDRNEVRVNGTCGGGVRSELKLKSDDGGIEAEFEVHQARGGSAWSVTIAQEGRVAWRGRVRTGRSSRAFTLHRRLRDYAGADGVTVRASGPSGVTCRASATLAGD